MVDNVFDLDKFRNFTWNKPRKRGRPRKDTMANLPEDLAIKYEYTDPDGNFRSYIIPMNGVPFPLESMNIHYKKFFMEVNIIMLYELSKNDVALKTELTDYLRTCFLDDKIDK